MCWPFPGRRAPGLELQSKPGGIKGSSHTRSPPPRTLAGRSDFFDTAIYTEKLFKAFFREPWDCPCAEGITAAHFSGGQEPRGTALV